MYFLKALAFISVIIAHLSNYQPSTSSIFADAVASFRQQNRQPEIVGCPFSSIPADHTLTVPEIKEAIVRLQTFLAELTTTPAGLNPHAIAALKEVVNGEICAFHKLVVFKLNAESGSITMSRLQKELSWIRKQEIKLLVAVRESTSELRIRGAIEHFKNVEEHATSTYKHFKYDTDFGEATNLLQSNIATAMMNWHLELVEIADRMGLLDCMVIQKYGEAIEHDALINYNDHSQRYAISDSLASEPTISRDDDSLEKYVVVKESRFHRFLNQFRRKKSYTF